MSQRTHDRTSSRRYRANDQRKERASRVRCFAVQHRRRVVILGIALTGLITLMPLPAAAELAPAIQADLYLVETEAYIKEKDYAAAQEAMGKILGLQEQHGLKLPDEFHFKYAQVLERAGSYDEAIESLNRYLELAGQAGTYYREALVLLHQATVAQTEAEIVAKIVANLEMVVVPAGSYMMGSPSSEERRFDHEGPVHRVTISEPFAVGVHEVTFDEWDACVSAGGCAGYRPDDEGWGEGRRPVINVSWEDAQRFVEWLREETGERYRLLSEAEWEYVARAGTSTPFHTGRTISASQANYDGNYTYGNGRKGEFRQRTVPVGTFGPNAFGLHDVHGNVWEWVEDCSNDSYRGAPSDGSAWDRGDCSRRVLRGGSWINRASWLRSAFRVRDVSGHRSVYLGFRVARTL